MRRLAHATALAALAVVLLAPTAEARVRHYWIAAVPVNWDIMPTGRDPITGQTFTKDQTVMQAVIYKRMTADWETFWPNHANQVGDNDGIPGPLIRARVGDTLKIHFKNMDTVRNHRHSMHFHGVKYRFGSDGAWIPGVSGPGSNVAPGRAFTYTLDAKRGSRGVWPYHDHAENMHESLDGGLYGSMSILGKNEKRADKENVVFFSTHRGFMTINGRAFPRNTPTPRAKGGHVVQWNVLALGSDHHTFHLHGHRWKFAGEWVDVRTIGPAESFRFRIKADHPGTWFYHCHVEAHMAAGMQGFFEVSGRARRAL